MRWLATGLLVLLLLPLVPPIPGHAEEFASAQFRAVWATTDAVVASGEISRAWIWGPEPITGGRLEPYTDAPNGQRLVQYFDKGRLELNRPGAAVTSGLLARELVTGLLQTGDQRLEQRLPAPIAMIGDPDDTLGPTYASVARLISRPALELNAPLVETIDRDGSVGADLLLSRYGARADVLVPETQHRLASVFRAYFEGDRLPNTEGETVQAAPFGPWYTVTGLPITEAYWTRARVGLIVQDVLVQVFERRVLTFTPANPPASRVEMGNVGRHYLDWLTRTTPPPPSGLPCPTIPEPPVSERRGEPYVVLGSTLHEIGSRRFVTGAVRNDGSSSVAAEITVATVDANGRVTGRYKGFTDRDFWPSGQVAAFRVELPTGQTPPGWGVSVRRPDDTPTGGLAEGLSVERLAGTVDGNGIGPVTGVLRYTGSTRFTDVPLVRVYALDACGSLVASTFTRVGGGGLEPGSVTAFSALLVNAEGASRIEAIIEARTGDISNVPADSLQVYQGGLYPAPVLPIIAVAGCCHYLRAYERYDGTTVRQHYQRTG